jgi:hypothetical protein
MRDLRFCQSQGNVRNAAGYKIAFGTLLALFLLAGLGAAQSGFTPTTTVITPREHGRIRDHIQLDDGTGTSSNWSGFAVTGKGFTIAKGSWHVPEVDCSKTPNAYSSFWVGLDGDLSGSDTVEQNGTDSDCSGTTPVYYAWYEFYPAGSVLIKDVPVAPGNIMYAEVSYNGSEFTLYIKNETTGLSHSHTKAVAGAKRNSAEWIAEAPSSSGGILPLADFVTANFGDDKTGVNDTNYATDSTISGPISDFTSRERITMVFSGGNKAVPTVLTTDGTSFIVDWKHE